MQAQRSIKVEEKEEVARDTGQTTAALKHTKADRKVPQLERVHGYLKTLGASSRTTKEKNKTT